MSAVPALTAPRHRLPWGLPQCAPRNRRWRAVCIVFCCLTALPGFSAAQEAVALPTEQTAGTISGTVVDQNGNSLLAARVSLIRPGQAEEKTQESDGAGRFV